MLLICVYMKRCMNVAVTCGWCGWKLTSWWSTIREGQSHSTHFREKLVNTGHIWLDYKWLLFTRFIHYSDWRTAICQGSALVLCAQLWSPTRPIWENWIWLETTWRTQEWSFFVVFWRVQPVDWRFWGQFTDCLLLLQILYL